MKNFDNERELAPRRPVEDRQFVIGGETFVARDRMPADVLTYLDSVKEERRDFTNCECGHRRHDHVSGPCAPANGAPCGCQKFLGQITQEGDGIAAQIESLDKTVIAMLEGAESEERWRLLRARTDDPLTLGDLAKVVAWLTAGETARPTGEPGASSPGLVPTGPSSTGASDSPEARAA